MAKKLVIAIVDDDEDIVSSLMERFAYDDIQVAWIAHTEADALEKLQSNTPDVLILDLNLTYNGGEGVLIYNTAKNIDKNIFVIGFSGSRFPIPVDYDLTKRNIRELRPLLKRLQEER